MNELINLGNGQFVKVTMLKGEKGSSIATITKTGTSGLVDTYTVTLTDGHTTTFTVTNGSSIESIEKTATVGLVDIYTITLTNGETSTFEVTNGNAENLQDAFQASQCAVKAGVNQVTFTNLGDAYITYIPNSECVENAIVVVGFDNGAMYKGTMNYSSALGKWGLSNVELIQGTDVPSTWDVGYGNDSVGTRAFRTGTDFVYSSGIGIALSTSSDVVSYYCVLSSGRVSDNYLQTQINQINSDLSEKCVDVSNEYSISSPAPAGLKLTAIHNPIAHTITLNVFGYGSYANANIGIIYPSEYTPAGAWRDMPCGRAINMTARTFVDVTASFGSNGITLFYSDNISVDRLTASITYPYS